MIDIDKNIEKELKLNKLSTTYPVYYKFFMNNLTERVSRLFIWDCDPVPQKEVERRMIYQGHSDIARYPVDKELTAFYGGLNGVTKYEDEFTHCTVRCPKWSKNLKIGEEVIVINNNSTRTPIIYLIDYYAKSLAHIECSIIGTLVNARKGNIIVTNNDKQTQAVRQYLTDIYNGKFNSNIVDSTFLGIETLNADKQTETDLLKLIELKERTLKNFYEDIGVRSSFQKVSNTIQAEVEKDTSLLMLNLDDMLACREKGCEEVNALFGTNWSVKLNPDIDYQDEEEKTEDNDENDNEEESDNETENDGNSENSEG